MNNNLDLQKPVLSLTAAELVEVLKKGLGQAMCGTGEDPQLNESSVATPQPHMVYGLKQLAKELNVSYQTAYRLYHSGALDTAAYKHGKCIAFNMDMVWDLLSISKKRSHGNYKFMRHAKLNNK